MSEIMDALEAAEHENQVLQLRVKEFEARIEALGRELELAKSALDRAVDERESLRNRVNGLDARERVLESYRADIEADRRRLKERLDGVEEAVIIRSTRYRLEEEGDGDFAIVRISDGERVRFSEDPKSARRALVNIELGIDREDGFFWEPARREEPRPDPMRDELLVRVRVLGERIQKLERQVDVINGEPKTRQPLAEEVRSAMVRELQMREIAKEKGLV